MKNQVNPRLDVFTRPSIVNRGIIWLYCPVRIELDLIGFDHASIDGTIFKANASKKRIIRIEELNYLNPY